MKQIIISILVLILSVFAGVLYNFMPSNTDFTRIQDPNIRLMSIANHLNDTTAPDFFIYDKPEVGNISRAGYCGIKFVEGTIDYYTRSFPTIKEAEDEGFTITH